MTKGWRHRGSLATARRARCRRAGDRYAVAHGGRQQPGDRSAAGRDERAALRRRLARPATATARRSSPTSTADPSVNWSDELEQLHEESTRTHFIDQWTRSAILGALGPLPAQPVIADIGCSTGHLLEDLERATRRRRSIGVDLVASGSSRRTAQRRTARLLRADACELPARRRRASTRSSAPTCSSTCPTTTRALARWRACCGPAARAASSSRRGPGTYDYYDRFLGHERRYARGELAAQGARARASRSSSDGAIAALLYPALLARQAAQPAAPRTARRRGAARRASRATSPRTKDSRVGARAVACGGSACAAARRAAVRHPLARRRPPPRTAPA